MKNINLLWILLLFHVVISSCSDDPVFPDPKFDSSTISQAVVRRDTADVFNLKCRMEVPNGISYIEILDAVDNYNLVDKIDKYDGMTSLDFSYPVDLTSFERDTLLGYVVKIYDKRNRTYNKAFQLEVKKFSRPEITFSNGDFISVMLPFISVQASLTTGMVPIRSIAVKLDGKTKKTIQPEKDTCDYSLENVILQGLREMRDYKIDVVLEDAQGRTCTKTQTVYRIDKIEKPVKVLLAGSMDAEMNLGYDGEERLTDIDLVGQFRMKFFYEDSRIVRIQEVEYGNYSDSIDYYFDYDAEGLLLSARESGNNTPIAQDITYYNDNFTKRIKQFVSGAAMVDNVAYTEDFVSNEYIFSEEWPVNINNVYPSIRLRMIGFEPVSIPTFLEGLPYPLIRVMRWPHVFHDLFLTKYVHSKTVSFIDESKVKFNYTYRMDDKGRLSEWRRLYTDLERVDYYKFVYE